MTGKYFVHDEILADFTTRSIHVAATVGKRLVEAHYAQKARLAYYLGCSTGGRQGIYSAQHHPDDFDGIVAGAPVVNFHNLMGSIGMISRYLGAPNPEESTSSIPPEMWEVVHREVLRQCDALDGVVDGMLTEPDACEFRPEELLCKGGKASTSSSSEKGCLSREQVEALRKVYGPLYGPSGEYLAPGFTLGAELSANAVRTVLSGKTAPDVFVSCCLILLLRLNTQLHFPCRNGCDTPF